MENGFKRARKVHETVLTYVQLDEVQRGLFKQMLYVIDLARDEGIDDRDIVAVLQEAFIEMAADEAGAAGD